MSTTAIDRDRLVMSLDEQEYHQLPGLSSTHIKWLLRSPAHYRHLSANRVEKAEFDLGHAVHAKVLGVGLDVEVIPGAWNTKAAKEAVEAARVAGKVPLKPETVAQVDAIAEAVTTHPVAKALLSNGHPEVSAFWTDETTGLACRGRFDWITTLADGRHCIVDLKTTGKPAPGFDRAVTDYGYDSQAFHYADGYRAITGEDPLYLWVVVETEAPHGVVIRQATEDVMRLGELKTLRAREILRDCLAADLWPPYPTDIEPVRVTSWALRDAEEKYL